jgi:ABC-type bacteriocin/lantibiotic exporter with double-glycine peptidase domain
MIFKGKFSFQSSAILRASRVLSPNELRKLFLVILIHFGLGMLDLLGVAIVGIMGALTITGVSSRQPGNRVGEFLRILNLENYGLQTQVTVLGVIAAIVLISKTILSMIILRKVTFFLSRRGAFVSKRLLNKLLGQPMTYLQARSMQRTLYSVTSGVESITVGILNTSVLICADSILLLVLAAGLFIVDPVVALLTIFMFGFVAWVLSKALSNRSHALGLEQAALSIENSERTLEVLNSFREIAVRNRQGFYSSEIGKLRLSQANISAERAFMPNISKYVIELTLVLGSLAIAALQFILNDAAHAVAVLAVFMAASTRIAPAVLRIQQAGLIIKGNLGSALPTLELFEDLSSREGFTSEPYPYTNTHEGFCPDIKIQNMSFTYPGKDVPAIKNCSMTVQAGQVVAIVGSSGAGKSTLVDLILGILSPSDGTILLSNERPQKAIQKWPGALGYVPQDVMISNGTIRTNVSLGYSFSTDYDESVTRAIEMAQLTQFVSSLPLGLDSHVGDRGAKISGGQRQRLGIARALFTHPRLLILDEATSSLDGEIEAAISDAIHELRGQVTVVIIAHRLSTVRNADNVFYLDSGQVIASGTFEEVRKQVPNFDQQAKLMGL